MIKVKIFSILFFNITFFVFSQSMQDSIAKVYVEYKHSFTVGSSFGDDKNNSRNEASQTNYFSLLANESISIFRTIPRINNALPEAGSNKVRFRTSTDNTVYLKNVKDSSSISQINYPAKFLVTDNLKLYSWDIFRVDSVICNYKVRKAIWENERVKVEAWYSTKLNFPHGPENYWGLPGLILGLNISSKSENPNSYYSSSYKCIKVRAPKRKEKIIKKPISGVVVSPQQLKDYYRKMVENQ